MTYFAEPPISKTIKSLFLYTLSYFVGNNFCTKFAAEIFLEAETIAVGVLGSTSSG